MDGIEDLFVYDVVFLQVNFNWNNLFLVEVVINLIVYVENGGGLVMFEWLVWNVVYNIGSELWDVLLFIFLVDLVEINGEDYLGEIDVIYISVNSELLVNDGVLSFFVFIFLDVSGMVFLFMVKVGVIVFYDMVVLYDGYDFIVVGMVGWEYQFGCVFLFNGINGVIEIVNDVNLC